jgi:hypothetical protein
MICSREREKKKKQARFSTHPKGKKKKRKRILQNILYIERQRKENGWGVDSCGVWRVVLVSLEKEAKGKKQKNETKGY